MFCAFSLSFFERTFASFDLVSSTSSSFSVLAFFLPPLLCFVSSDDLYY